MVLRQGDELAGSAEGRAGVAGVGDVVVLIIEYQDVGSAASIITYFILHHALSLELPPDLVEFVVPLRRLQHFVHLVEVLLQSS